MNGMSSHHHAVIAAVGMMLLCGLVNCVSSLPSGDGPGSTGGGGGAGGAAGAGVCFACGTFPNCWSEAGCTGHEGGGSGGGSGGSAGSGGAGASGGSAGTGWAPPTCLRDLFAACPIDGACAGHVGDGGVDGYCFASGARAEIVETPICDGRPSHETVRISKSDGSLCFTISISLIGGCEIGSYTWTDASGNVVATATYGMIGASGRNGTVQCAATPEMSSCNDSAGCHAGYMPWLFGASLCSSGDCP